jgi:hypothetical protein
MFQGLLMLAQEALTQETVATDAVTASALPEALRISGIALVAIFLVMGLFGTMIALFTRVFPVSNEES